MIFYSTLPTPIGNMLAAANENGICYLGFVDGHDVETELKKLNSSFNDILAYGINLHLANLKEQLSEYFDSKRKEFSVPIDMFGTPFQKKVWQSLLCIPHGKTISYKTQALALRNMEGIRAVAHANAKNKIAIIIPCHRVVGYNGSLTGYAGGIWRKRFLLNLEQQNLELPFES